MSDTNNTNSDSPILFLEISKSYLNAFDIIWHAEFSSKNKFYWDGSLILHPISQLLGIGIETAIKGILVCRDGKVQRTHNLDCLNSKLDDGVLSDEMDRVLSDISVPQRFIDLNNHLPKCEAARIYRSHGYQLHLLNRVYNRPFVSRYPELGVYSLPNPEALRKLLVVIHRRLETDCRSWKPDK